MAIVKPTFMTQEQAAFRSASIQHETIHYELSLLLDKGKTFRGHLVATFVVENSLTQDLFIDFRGGHLINLTINGQVVAETKPNYSNVFDGLFVKLPLNLLLLGQKNTVVIKYENDYADDGLGLHSFTDTDGKQYIYSQCEAFWCNRIFPNFDQPDLKATLTLSALHPSDWIVLSNTPADNPPSSTHSKDTILSQLDSDNQSLNLATFPKTKLLPSYIFGFAAGPYNLIKGPNALNGIPLNLYARESMIPHLEKYADFIFEITDQCMQLFEKFFGYPYPFEKYDQIFCPEFNCGAMENAGLVTFNDTRFVFKEDISDTRMSVYLNVIAHELSHHWFGNLVTMKWWNDLWLNESFADFIGHFALTKITSKIRRIADGWVLFNNRKVWGYNTDQQITTHPIAGDVANTEAAESIFDGITYAKGASTMRQLLSLMGEDRFSSAMKRYFNKYAFKNAELKDFISNLEVEFSELNLGFTLAEWQQEWIQTAGLNECYPVFDPSNSDPAATLKILQTCALEAHPTLRKHNMKVAFFDENCQITEQTIVLSASSETTLQYDGSKQFKAVLLNYGDYAFIKVLLDPASLDFFKANLHRISDTLTRTLTWKAFYDMVRDGKLSTEEYVNIFTNCLRHETSEEIVSAQFTYLANAIKDYTPSKYTSALKQKLFSFCLEFLQATPKEQKNKIITIKGALIHYASSEEHIDMLVKWFHGQSEVLKEFEIGNDGQWAIVTLAHFSQQYSLETKREIFNEQLKRDQSDTSKNMEQKCRALVATPEERVALWSEYINKEKYSQRVLNNSMEGFIATKKQEDILPYQQKWFTDILTVYANQIQEYANIVFDTLSPKSDDLDWLIQEFNKLLEKVPDSSVFFSRRIKETLDLLQRKKKAFACFYERLTLE